MYRRRALSLALLLTSLALPGAASGQEWPTKTITVIVPLGAGSASDIIARVVMEQVGRQLGQTVVVENRPGAGGTIGDRKSTRLHSSHSELSRMPSSA